MTALSAGVELASGTVAVAVAGTGVSVGAVVGEGTGGREVGEASSVGSADVDEGASSEVAAGLQATASTMLVRNNKQHLII